MSGFRRIRDYLESTGADVRFVNLPFARYRMMFTRPDLMSSVVAGKIRFENTELLKERIRLKLSIEALRKVIKRSKPDLILCEGTSCRTCRHKDSRRRDSSRNRRSQHYFSGV